MLIFYKPASEKIRNRIFSGAGSVSVYFASIPNVLPFSVVDAPGDVPDGFSSDTDSGGFSDEPSSTEFTKINTRITASVI